VHGGERAGTGGAGPPVPGSAGCSSDTDGPGPQAVEVMRKTLDDLRAEQRAGAQRIAAWAGEASTTLVPLGVSPIPALVRPASISDVLPVLDSAADRLRRLDQILGARLEAEGSRICRSAIEYILTCF
jgi:hypothetical protein